MTIQITVQCDGKKCNCEVEVNGTHDSDIESEGWTVDPDDGYQHYCPSCWHEIEEKAKDT